MRARWIAMVLAGLGLSLGSAAVYDMHGAPDAMAAKRRARSRRPAAPAAPRPIERTQLYTACPAEMVSIAGRFCIDRWEATAIDAETSQPVSPYYPPEPRLAQIMWKHWNGEIQRAQGVLADAMLDAGAPPDAAIDAAELLMVTGLVMDLAQAKVMPEELDAGTQRPRLLDPATLIGDAGPHVLLEALMPLPELPEWQKNRTYNAKAVSRPDVIPQGYVPGFVAPLACRQAGKRLCREDEWVTACKGQGATKHPYGDEYRQGACNVFREEHPGRVLHGSWSTGLSDPRLNLIRYDGTVLLRETGGSPLCKSVWGDDAVYDMVGNVDEWVDEPAGLFVGGFFSRNTRSGCEAKVASHPVSYFDYSLGFRCCADLVGGS